ncbi:MAG: FtsX-like permease family protein [Gammaproteobacteria bacterium]|jgi:putative ABC transport system permease protein
MLALDRKLFRDMNRLRGQAFAIVAVMASGVACFIMFLSTLDSLQLSRELYYRDYRFAEVFAPLKRAPESVKQRIATIEGLDKIDTRVVAPITIDIEGFPEPVTGVVTSIPDRGEPLLNRLYLRSGRLVEAGRDDEIVISNTFAEAHDFHPGDQLHIIIRGKRKQLHIVGIGSSPEYIHQLRPGGNFPDFEHFGVMWMARTPLSHAYEMDGAFNDVVITLSADAKEQDVIDRLDMILKPYGSTGAYIREDQVSHKFLTQELKQMETLAGLFPVIFLGVAAFLLNVVVTRLVGNQREQIAALKAFGYDNFTIAIHYLKMIMLIVAAGIIVGTAAGTWLGVELSKIYVGLFRLPFLNFELQPVRIIQVSLFTVIAGLVGTLAAVRTVITLKPAEAMRPEAPAVYRQTFIETLGLKNPFSAPTRMILRHIGHKPLKSALSVLGIALACAILMTGRFQEDTITFMMDVHYGLSERDDISLVFSEPTSYRALAELRSLPGVEYGEAGRTVPARLVYEHRSYLTAVHGYEPNGEIKRLVNAELEPVTLPQSGIVLNEYLAKEILGVRVGDLVTVEVLEGSQPIRQIPVVSLVHQDLSVGAYMDLAELNRLMREGNAISDAYLYIDESRKNELFERLKERPRIVSTLVREQEIMNFYRIMDETMLFWTFVATLFAGVIAVGIVYNSARITLTERSRELASLRVLGFTRGEISYILLGELAILTLLAIPPGLFIGYGLCGYIALSLENELYRVPLVLEPHTYAFSALVILIAATVSGLLVRRQLDHLDLIEVLKTKE